MDTHRSLRVVLASVGSRGDVQPMLALAQTLLACGHVPVIAAPPNVESWVRRLGFEFAPLGIDIQQWLAEHSDVMTGNPVTMLKAVVIHHGGSGTTAQALRAGVPQVLLPLILDQFHHAHRLHLAGIAQRPVPMERITATELTRAIQAALQLPAGPRDAAAARLRQTDGRGDIVRRVESMVAA